MSQSVIHSGLQSTHSVELVAITPANDQLPPNANLHRTDASAWGYIIRYDVVMAHLIRIWIFISAPGEGRPVKGEYRASQDGKGDDWFGRSEENGGYVMRS